MTLDEIPNDITKKTPACFEPTIDYVVVKIPKWQFEKFAGCRSHAGHADEVGGRSDGDWPHVQGSADERVFGRWNRAAMARAADDPVLLSEKLATPRPDRIHWTACTHSNAGLPVDEVCELTKIDPWFMHQIEEISLTIDRQLRATIETCLEDLLREVEALSD